ncbi:kinase-like protein [Exidia glandulosa HHB12029]|uniref:Kinase-like protein n=1 Tax=Exidia glandulosa HHB12029 TaxID=1314781 RepID=A0A165ZGJ6_EXIGL|nr:kinase-like protein [Exidia glandulosa HHB12029]
MSSSPCSWLAAVSRLWAGDAAGVDSEPRPMFLEPNNWLLSFIPTWGEVRVDRRIRNADSISQTPSSLAKVHWLWKRRDVLLEELPAAMKERKGLIRQVRTLRRIHHPNVQEIFGICRSDDASYVVLSPASQAGLLPFLRAKPSTDRRRIVLQVVDAIRYLHKLKIVHGDLRADNVMVSSESPVTPVVSGFGPLLCRCDGSSSDQRDLSWANTDEDSKPRWFSWTVALESDVPHEPVVEGRYYSAMPSSVIVEDTDLPDLMKMQADAALSSLDQDGDIFSLGFLIIEIFNELSPRNSLQMFEVLRKALKRQQPLHPGAVAELRGFGNRHWNACLSCWRVGSDEAPTLQSIVAKLVEPNDRIIIPPFERDLSRRDFASIPRLKDQIRDIQKHKNGRDAELGMYEVQGSWYQPDGRAVVVKIITPDLCRRGTMQRDPDFFAEAFTWCQLRHPNILPLLATVFYETDECFVVPWMSEGTCVDYLRTHPDADRLSLLVDVADALHYLHTREPKVLHGNVRARSVSVYEDGTAYLGNFDFQPLQDPERQFDESYFDKARRWAAPERGLSLTLTTKCDVFSFAMFAYEVYSGCIPYFAIADLPLYGPNLEPVVDVKAKGGRPDRPSSDTLCDAVWDVVQRCWDHAPRLRPSMGTVVRELRQIQTERRAQQETS